MHAFSAQIMTQLFGVGRAVRCRGGARQASSRRTNLCLAGLVAPVVPCVRILVGPTPEASPPVQVLSMSDGQCALVSSGASEAVMSAVKLRDVHS